MQFSTNFWSFLRKNKEKPVIYHKKPRVFVFQPKMWLKNLLIWFETMQEEDDINKVINYWTKSLAKWVLEIFVNGILVYLGFLPFIHFPFSIGSMFSLIFSFGILVFLLSTIWNGFVNGSKKITSSLPRK